MVKLYTRQCSNLAKSNEVAGKTRRRENLRTVQELGRLHIFVPLPGGSWRVIDQISKSLAFNITSSSIRVTLAIVADYRCYVAARQPDRRIDQKQSTLEPQNAHLLMTQCHGAVLHTGHSYSGVNKWQMLCERAWSFSAAYRMHSRISKA